MPDKDEMFPHDEVYGSGSYRQRAGRGQRRERTLRDWYGPDAGSFEIEGRQPPPHQLADLIGAQLEGMDAAEHRVVRELLEVWETLVTPEIAAVAAPRRFDRGCLFIEVWDHSWVYILRTRHEREMLATIRRQTNGLVKRLRVIPAGSTGRRGRKPGK